MLDLFRKASSHLCFALLSETDFDWGNVCTRSGVKWEIEHLTVDAFDNYKQGMAQYLGCS